MQSLEKIWKMSENIEILTCNNRKEKKIIYNQNQINMLQIFSQKTY